MIQPSPRRCCCCPEAPLSPPSTLIPPQTTTDRLAESRAALERKAALYERLARGEVEDEGGWVGGWGVWERGVGVLWGCDIVQGSRLGRWPVVIAARGC